MIITVCFNDAAATSILYFSTSFIQIYLILVFFIFTVYVS